MKATSLPQTPASLAQREKHTVSRRILDVLAATGGLLVLSPLLVAIALAIKLGDGGPLIYRSERVGQDSIHFHLYKFRTMIQNADQQGPGITTANDPRITRVGILLRRYKLDELPQLWNVLRGEMSLVGPRPEDPQYVAHYTTRQRSVLTTRPGLTSPASLAYHNEAQHLTGVDWETTYRETVLPAKLNLELDYLRHRTLFSDIKIILRTIATLVYH